MVTRMRYSDSVDNWIKGMALKSNTEVPWESLCILHNVFEREFSHRNFEGADASVLCLFLECVGQKYDASGDKNSARANAVIDETLIEFQVNGCPLYSKGRLVESKGVSLSRVMTAETFMNRCLDNGMRKTYSPRRPRNLDRLARDLSDDKRRNIVRKHLEGRISGRYKCAFVTKSDSISSLPVDEIPAVIGKSDWGYTHLVEVKYPPDFASSTRLRTPTIFSAGPNGLFRSLCFEGDGWGMTVQTHDFSPGIPEAVHEECDINGEFDIRYLGKTKEHPEFDRYKGLLQFNREMVSKTHPFNISCRQIP